MSDRKPTVTPSQRSRRLLFSLLLLFVFGGLISIPWQMRQWSALRHEQEQTRLQENRISELQRTQQDIRSALAQNTASSDSMARLQSAETLARAERSTEALARINGLEKEFANNATLLEQLAGIYQQLNYVDKAYPLTREALRLEPKNPEIGRAHV